MDDYHLRFEQRAKDGTPTKVWFQARSPYKDLRRGAEKALGPLTGRQWKKARRRMMAHTKQPPDAA